MMQHCSGPDSPLQTVIDVPPFVLRFAGVALVDQREVDLEFVSQVNKGLFDETLQRTASFRGINLKGHRPFRRQMHRKGFSAKP